jgi:excisionase family DNA binding protein
MPVPSAAELPLLLTEKQMGALLNCSGRHVRRLVDSGRFPPPAKIGHLTRWPRSVVEEFVAGVAAAPKGVRS